MAVCLFFDVIYIICKKQNKLIIGLIAKCIASLCFIAIGYISYVRHNSNFNYLILIGLILDGIGDLFLAIRNIAFKQTTFILGALSFLAGHVYYIRAQFPIANYYLMQCIFAGIVVGAIIFYLLSNACRFKKVFVIIGIVYCIMITIMSALSVGIYLTNKIESNLLFMIGTLLFVSSDIILILNQFSKKVSWMHPVYSLLYFIAQIIISYSLYLV